MKNPRLIKTVAISMLASLAISQAIAQTASSVEASPASPSGEVVQLPAFEIRSEKDTSYAGTSSLSSTRVAVDLSELSQSVKVLNNSFLQAINPSMMSDMLNYVGGGQNGQLSWTSGRMNVRGFTGDGDYEDGFAPSEGSQLDNVLFERFEIIKGPSAIFLAADGSPGGIINKIVKSPQSKQATTITLQTGLFEGNKASVDSTGPITKDGKLAYRVIASQTYYNGYYDYTYMHRFASLFALSYSFSSDSKLEIKAQVFETNWPSYNGLPIDPRTLKMIDVPYTSTQDLPAPMNWRHDNEHRVWGSYNTRLNNNLAWSTRAMRAFERTDRLEAIAPTWTEGSNVWTNSGVATTPLPGQPSWSGPSNYTGGAIPRNTVNADDAHDNYNDIQSDLNFNYTGKNFTELLLVGIEHRDSPGATQTWKTGVNSTTFSAWYPYAPSTPATMAAPINYTTPSAYIQRQSLQNRGYALETLKLFSDKLILSFGVSRACTYSGNYNYLKGAWSSNPYNLNKNLTQYGVVVKVAPGVSLFTGYNQNFSLNGIGTLNGVPNSVYPPKQGFQHEVGIKTDYLNHRLTFDLSYFDIKQINNTVPSFPLDPLNPNVLIPGVISRGFDGDWTFKATPDLYFMGSFANYSAKSLLGPAYNGYVGSKFVQPGTNSIAYGSIPVDNTAQQTESIYALYNIRSGDFKGLQIGLGENYQAKRAITDGPNQVFWGYVPSRVVLNSTINYEYNSHIKYTMTIDNLLNKKYIYSVRSENVIVPGTPINVKFSVSYSL
jgi:iron complex outermembrane recepter protein